MAARHRIWTDRGALGPAGPFLSARSEHTRAGTPAQLGTSEVSYKGLSYPLVFAGGAVLASVIDTLAPEALGDGGPVIALASATGFVTGILLSL